MLHINTNNKDIKTGSPAFRRVTLALTAAGFSTFAVLYCVQPLLPVFTAKFHVSPAESSLALSLSTGLLGIGLLIAGPLSDVWGRKPVMVGSLFASALLTLVASVEPSWPGLLLMRALAGLTLGGVPAVAMAYLSEEMHAKAIGLAMGLYISGNALGGMSGRLVTGALTDLSSWRVAIAAIGALALLAAVAFWHSLPPSSNFTPHALRWREIPSSFLHHFGDPGLPWLFAEAFLVMGGFVTLYNYIGFRLLAPPFNLSQTTIGAIFIVYLVGSASSTWVGHLAGRFGRRKVLWLTITVAIAGVGSTVSEGLWPSSPAWSWSRPASSGRIRWPAAGSGDARCNTERRPPRCTCCSTTLGPACLGPRADGSGRGRVGPGRRLRDKLVRGRSAGRDPPCGPASAPAGGK